MSKPKIVYLKVREGCFQTWSFGTEYKYVAKIVMSDDTWSFGLGHSREEAKKAAKFNIEYNHIEKGVNNAKTGKLIDW